MIKFVPSKSIIKYLDFDFNLIGYIISQFITDYRGVFKLHKSRDNCSYFYIKGNVIKLDINKCQDFEYCISTLLHELRHYMQYKFFKRSIFMEYDSYKDYYSAPEEVDARNYEILKKEICTIYNAYKKLHQKIISNQLDSLKELQYNIEKNENAIIY